MIVFLVNSMNDSCVNSKVEKIDVSITYEDYNGFNIAEAFFDRDVDVNGDSDCNALIGRYTECDSTRCREVLLMKRNQLYNESVDCTRVYVARMRYNGMSVVEWMVVGCVAFMMMFLLACGVGCGGLNLRKHHIIRNATRIRLNRIH